jgi:hypothetical protein
MQVKKVLPFYCLVYNFTSMIEIYSKKNSQCIVIHLQALRVLIIWRLLTLPRVTAVPSALRGLTSLFGMGRGEHPHYNHHKGLERSFFRL